MQTRRRAPKYQLALFFQCGSERLGKATAESEPGFSRIGIRRFHPYIAIARRQFGNQLANRTQAVAFRQIFQ
ncbi:hypothetical protein GALL_533220 [mine drainage metagenome]|uniref:Uncharacterized protein n=1 Tax=mine drainage metagenome TaxID=410659 RepID=A0A1J5PIM0_9ZZZZ